MTRPFRPILRIVIILLLAAVTGCGSSKSDGVVNPDLPVPKVPPSNRGTVNPLDAN